MNAESCSVQQAANKGVFKTNGDSFVSQLQTDKQDSTMWNRVTVSHYEYKTLKKCVDIFFSPNAWKKCYTMRLNSKVTTI